MGGETTVLIVDDEPLYADAHARMLGDRYRVKTAYSGADALDSIDDVDVLLIDRKMPELSGDDVVDELERRGVDCRRIMVTALEAESDGLDAVDGYLTKPVTPDELTDCIERALSC
ncbi:response regulator [Natronobiforma cellulositropha]|uniref:response regulator n=1 Tax=Natronobiforma cellulositropha TaxID=1679076 RepID=UPI0021D5B526|nr:response regulator [Natronobiforma cellulositropha]